MTTKSSALVVRRGGCIVMTILVVMAALLMGCNPSSSEPVQPAAPNMVQREVGFYNDLVNADEIVENNFNYGIDVFRLATEAGCRTPDEYHEYFVQVTIWAYDPVVTAEVYEEIPVEFPFADALGTAQQAFHQDYINSSNPGWDPLLLPGESIDEARDRFMLDPSEEGVWDTVANRLYQIEVEAAGYEVDILDVYTSQGFTKPRDGNDLPSAVQMATVNSGGHVWKRTYSSGVTAESRPECMFQWVLPPGTEIPGVPTVPPPPYLEAKDPSTSYADDGNYPIVGAPATNNPGASTPGVESVTERREGTNPPSPAPTPAPPASGGSTTPAVPDPTPPPAPEPAAPPPDNPGSGRAPE